VLVERAEDVEKPRPRGKPFSCMVGLRVALLGNWLCRRPAWLLPCLMLGFRGLEKFSTAGSPSIAGGLVSVWYDLVVEEDGVIGRWYRVPMACSKRGKVLIDVLDGKVGFCSGETGCEARGLGRCAG
jgi:hypothetical protein